MTDKTIKMYKIVNNVRFVLINMPLTMYVAVILSKLEITSNKDISDQKRYKAIKRGLTFFIVSFIFFIV